jgi:LuxR family maltose regulon positive regulatory protein
MIGTSIRSIVDPLSEREVEVLQWLAAGASNREIGRRLYIAESTVKRHVYNIYGKLNVRNRTQAALRATELGLDPYPNLLQLSEEGL